MSENVTDPQQLYQSRYSRYSSESSVIRKRIQQISNLRLLIFVLVIAWAVYLFRSDNYLMLIIDLFGGIAVFTAVVLWHSSLYGKYKALLQKVRINEIGLQRLKGEWSGFKDSGDDFIDQDHPFTWDLDIFGKCSVFQWISVCHTYLGRKSLSVQLSEPVRESQLIIQKQNAVGEMSFLLDWRQELEFHGINSDTGVNPEKFLKWSETDDPLFKNKAIIFLFRLLPYISFVTGVIGFLVTRTLAFFAIMYTFQFLLFAVFHSKVIKAIQAFEKNGPLLLAYSRLLQTIDNASFSSEYINNLKLEFKSDGKSSASEVFYLLSKVLNAAEVRFSPMAHMFANAILLWDFQCIIKADRLKKDSGKRFRTWIETIGQFEALSSLANIRFENPHWVFPSFSAKELLVRGENLGHPLLKRDSRIVNDYPYHKGGTVAVITGSNMSGKSTFLRTVGINLVLAFAGAPVCASTFMCSSVQIYSSMRINDDLSSGVSTFYAELLRIKKMVEAVKRGETIFFLLDELFRGTNSEDRHEGALAVINALSNQKSMGIISTHDLQLCSLAHDDKKKYVNYHFEEKYNGDSITFDYKLNHGQSRTKNAMFLIKMMGI